jgi:two-component system nitrogen regulation response regulator NtrX
MTHRVLLVDDEANIRRMLGALLRAEGYEVAEAANSGAAIVAVEQARPDVILLDFLMPPGPDGIATLRELRTRGVDAPVIMMSGKANIGDAVRATKHGAFQFLEKPLSPDVVMVTVESAVSLSRTQQENRALREAVTPRTELVGGSQALDALRELIAQVGPTETRVLITGESGTGKELVAGAIHAASRRRDRAFVTVNCAAIPRDLIESEMFGHERGAFTGATDRRLGRFELADRGTLFLDEVGDLSLEAQAKLLRTLETSEVQRVGGESTVQIDVRILAATNHDLSKAVSEGTFRQDLYFRLHVFPIHVPPLREHIEDLPALVRHLAARISPRTPPQFTSDALDVLMHYPWPGNVRELANIVERLTILGGQDIDTTQVRRVLPVAAHSSEGAPPAPTPLLSRALSDALDDYERSLIAAAVTTAGGNIAEAARILQTDRGNLYRRLKRLGISPSAVIHPD